MEENYESSSDSDHYGPVPLSTDRRRVSVDHSNRPTADTENVDDKVTDCLHFQGKKYEDLVLEDLEGVEFKSVDAVDQFYSYYSLAMGFSVRKHKADKNNDGSVRRRQLLCSRQGQRRPQKSKKQRFCNDAGSVNEVVSCENQQSKPPPTSRRITRCNCPARLTAHLSQTGGVYNATEFVTEHNHELVRPEHVHFLRSHRHVMDHDIAQASALRKVSVGTSKAYDLMAQQAGGYAYVGFTLKDLYNHLDSGRRDILVDGDAQAAIGFMNMKALRDPYFHCFFCVDEHGHLANLYWRDSQSLIDYNIFGDVLIMDTTYKSNIYGKPLAVFVGVNNHRATVLFGCALLVDETEDTYRWVISNFIHSMNGRKPISVITDGDAAMRNAISYLIPDARQRLCSWHISKNVCSNIHDVDVQRDFFHLIYAGLTVDEWEAAWRYMVAMNGLENNKWVTGMYNKRTHWAEAFFRDHFFAGICSTQRCESMHKNLKGGLGRSLRLYDVLPRMDMTIARMRERALEDEYRSISSSPVIGGHLRCLQVQIAKIFTHEIFLLLKDQIGFESNFVVLDRDELSDPVCSVFQLTQFNKPGRKWVVTYSNNFGNTAFKCSCKLFESDGIPCCHIFAIMKSVMLTTYPKSLVTKRWTIAAGLSTNISRTGGFPDQLVRVARYGEMMSECAHLCFAASFSDEGYEGTINVLRRLNIRSKKFPVQPQQSNDDHFEGLHPNVVKDPIACRTKGTQSNEYNSKKNTQGRDGPLCGYCSRPGHNIRTCPTAKEARINCNSPLQYRDATPAQYGQSPSIDDEDNDLALSSGAESENEEDDFIDNIEDGRTFEFFSGYENHLNSAAGSTHYKYPNTTSNATSEAGLSFRSSGFNENDPLSLPFPHT